MIEIQKINILTVILDEFFAGAVSEKITPGAAVGVSLFTEESSKEPFTYHYGNVGYRSNDLKIKEDTFFDLASLTKPLVTVLCLLKLVQKKIIYKDTTLAELLPLTEVPIDKKNIQLWQLMSHCSGLPAHRVYYREALAIPQSARKDFYIQSILAENLEYIPGQKHIYSDLGYILLGHVIEQQSGKGLDIFFEDMVKPFGLHNILKYRPLGYNEALANCAFTEVCPWTHRMLCGVVHDDNCRVMGGVAGHAGLFGTVRGVIDLCTLICEVWQGRNIKNLFSPALLRSFLHKTDGSSWTCGFDTPSGCNSSSGKLFSPLSVGHLGFTGTSLWIDIEKGISVVLLTNRVHPTRKNEKLKKLRPEFHNIIMENLPR